MFELSKRQVRWIAKVQHTRPRQVEPAKSVKLSRAELRDMVNELALDPYATAEEPETAAEWVAAYTAGAGTAVVNPPQVQPMIVAAPGYRARPAVG